MDSNDQTFSIRRRAHSFRHASRGVVAMLASQHNAWVHALATLAVVVLGWTLGVSAVEWCLLLLAMVIVWVAEALNTALESLCDVVSPDFHPLVRRSKDIAAGGVLLGAMGAAVLGTIIFLPYLLLLL
ncbi:MAG: diacylglycerol kinase family protein [Halioglobus sp.]|nr:diacylglycerol kinase family protein [Halioglobus sp.]